MCCHTPHTPRMLLVMGGRGLCCVLPAYCPTECLCVCVCMCLEWLIPTSAINAERMINAQFIYLILIWPRLADLMGLHYWIRFCRLKCKSIQTMRTRIACMIRFATNHFQCSLLVGRHLVVCFFFLFFLILFLLLRLRHSFVRSLVCSSSGLLSIQENNT